MSSLSPKVFLFILRFDGILNKWWAFKQMGQKSWKKNLEERFSFFKMMGTGSGNGFGIVPDFSTYVWLVTAESLKDFTTTAPVPAFLNRLNSIRIFEMMPTKSHGLWNARNPFQALESTEHADDFPWISVITRGSIKRSLWWKFWKYVPKVSRQISSKALYTVGMGELPIVEQATFSVWASEDDMKSWAYQNAIHRQVISLTRKLNWYDEEMFTRFCCREVYLRPSTQ